MDEGEAYVSQWKTEFDDTSDKKNMQVVGGGGFSNRSDAANLRIRNLTFAHSGPVVDDKGGNIFIIISHVGKVVGSKLV